MSSRRRRVALAVLTASTLIGLLLPRLAAADLTCNPVTRRVIVGPGDPPPSITVEADYPDPCWELVSATLEWLDPTHGLAEFVVRDMHAVTPGCPTVIQTHSVTASLLSGAEGCGMIAFHETILEADGLLRSESTCDMVFVIGPMVGLPDLDQCTASSAGGVVMVCPAGDGQTLASQGATVTITLHEAACNAPIVGFPKEDAWLQSVAPGSVHLCPGGITADANSDAAGVMTMGGAIAGGGWSEAGLRVVLAGNPILSLLDIRVHSPDITGDLHVDLADVGPFSADLAARSGFRSDFFFDGVVNLADVGMFSAHLSHVCD